MHDPTWIDDAVSRLNELKKAANAGSSLGCSEAVEIGLELAGMLVRSRACNAELRAERREKCEAKK